MSMKMRPSAPTPPVEIRSLRIFQIDEEAPDPRRHVLVEDQTIGIRRRRQPAARKAGHDLTQNAGMIFRLHDAFRARDADRRKIVAEPRERTLVQEAGQIV